MTATQTKSSAALWVVGAAALLLGGIVTALVAHDTREAPEVVACKIALKQNLKAPSTVEYGEVIHHGGETPGAHLTFDAENGFSAMIRGTAACDFKRDGEDLVLTKLLIDGQEVEGMALTLTRNAVQRASMQ